NLTNGVPILHQRPGANSPYLVTTNGITNQWNFFVFTNAITNLITGTNMTKTATNVAITTFLPPNLSRPRFREADIDLYVSPQAGLTNLDDNVIATARKGLGRGGTESVIITNAQNDPVFYVAVKSEDQQSADYGIFAIATDEPFSNTDSNGNKIVRFFLTPSD